MSDFFYYLWRFILASMAWLAAVIVTAFVINMLLFAVANHGPADQADVENIFQASLTTTPFTIFYVATGTFIPSLFILVWAEFARRRDWLFYSLAGLLMGVGIAGYNLVRNTQAMPSDYVLFMGTTAAAGIIAGSVYWLIAGRGAGPRR
ncbi:hypothetical protein ATN84_04350 [Paramesorhizobium deserti]|uniref:DUF2177 domain-containing protein n=1 Tax=Paramesorhizobium deserti TaxID=1494590 RepID=A0A135I0M2_9HYPH|nr:hypothetical protein [Paramesorhizobium deserti]KXF78985.1 hypothetical protein ATN84_04350 [Paramesorhizobium deserti]